MNIGPTMNMLRLYFRVSLLFFNVLYLYSMEIPQPTRTVGENINLAETQKENEKQSNIYI